MRNAEGKFDVVNDPSDSAGKTQRSVFNGLFFVVRDPGFVAKREDLTRTSVNITLKENNLFSQMQNVKVKVNNQTYDMNSESLLIEGLEEDTEYTALITFDFIENGKTTKDSFELTFKTKAFQMPDSGLQIAQINKENIKVIKKATDYSSWIKNVRVHVSGNEYYMGDVDEYLVENLISGTEYNVYFTYDVVEPATGNVYKGQTDIERITTTLVELPTIIKLQLVENTPNAIKVEYEYEDDDDAVVGAYILCGAQKFTLNRKRGTITIENLDKTQTEYVITLQLLYYPNPESTMFAEEMKQELKVEAIKEEQPAPTEKKKGCKKSSAEMIITTISASSLLVMLLRKKK